MASEDQSPASNAIQHGIEYLLGPQHLRQLRELRERPHQVLDPPRLFVLAPQVVGPARQHGVRTDGGLLNARSAIGLDRREQRFVADHDPEGVDGIALADRHHHAVG